MPFSVLSIHYTRMLQNQKLIFVVRVDTPVCLQNVNFTNPQNVLPNFANQMIYRSATVFTIQIASHNAGW